MRRVDLMLGILLWLAPQLLSSQGPGNDHCAKATPIKVGQHISNVSNAAATTGYPFENPGIEPVTCIQTLENDLWFKFRTTAEYEIYEVIIAARFCSTPAGLQAMLIRSEDCNNKHYQYTACSNKQNLDTIKLFMQNPGAGQQHFIYVDGYDGTVCDFDVFLRGKKKMMPEDYRYLRYDYFTGEVPFGFPDGLETSFNNNVAIMNWTSNPDEDVSYFVVERLIEPEGMDKESAYFQVVGILDPRNFVGSGEMNYEFMDFITFFEEGKPYQYRILSVDSKGERAVSETFSITAELVKEFFTGQVEPTGEKNVFSVYYINRKKKQNLSLSVLNTKDEVVKNTVLKKVPVQDGSITVHMEEHPPGQYFLKMSNGKGSFLREFTVE